MAKGEMKDWRLDWECPSCGTKGQCGKVGGTAPTFEDTDAMAVLIQTQHHRETSCEGTPVITSFPIHIEEEKALNPLGEELAKEISNLLGVFHGGVLSFNVQLFEVHVSYVQYWEGLEEKLAQLGAPGAVDATISKENRQSNFVSWGSLCAALIEAMTYAATMASIGKTMMDASASLHDVLNTPEHYPEIEKGLSPQVLHGVESYSAYEIVLSGMTREGYAQKHVVPFLARMEDEDHMVVMKMFQGELLSFQDIAADVALHTCTAFGMLRAVQDLMGRTDASQYH